MNGPNWNLNEDIKTLTVTFPTNPPATLTLDVNGVDDIIKNLGEFRALMTPSVSYDHPLGQRVAAIPDPRWSTEPDVMLGDSLLHIRDPRFGWLHYLIPRHEARQLAGGLQAQVDAQPPGQGPGKPN